MDRLRVSGHHCKCATTIFTIFSRSAMPHRRKTRTHASWIKQSIASEFVIIAFLCQIQKPYSESEITLKQNDTGEKGVLPLSIHLPGFRLWRLPRPIRRLLILCALGSHFNSSPPWQFEHKIGGCFPRCPSLEWDLVWSTSPLKKMFFALNFPKT